MNVNPTLAHLLEIQGALLDSYLYQNLGVRYAYVIYAVPIGLDGPVAGVSNIHAPVLERGAELIVAQLSQLHSSAEIHVEPVPRVVQRIDLQRPRP